MTLLCIIIDANVAGRVFVQHPDGDAAPVLSWLTSEKRDGRLVYGGRLCAELERTSARRFLAALVRAGRAVRVADEDVHREEGLVARTGRCKSDDQHVIALARLSGARTLYSLDRSLQADFKNPALVCDPRGCIYTKAAHRRLLRHTSSCSRRRGSVKGCS